MAYELPSFDMLKLQRLDSLEGGGADTFGLTFKAREHANVGRYVHGVRQGGGAIRIWTRPRSSSRHWATVNARIDYDSASGDYSLAIFGTHLTDD